MADDSGAPVAYLRTLEDALRLKERLTAGTRIGIVGAGWIGLEVAAAARNADAEVTVLETLDQPLLRVVGPEVGEIFARLHREHGVDLRTGIGITGIERSGGGALVHLREGDPVDCDLLVVGIGIEPVVEPAGAAGLVIDNGIRTDSHLRTSDPQVFAAGDVANADHPRLGRPVRAEHWDTAIQHGKVVAANLLGQDTQHDALPYFFTDQYDLGMEYVGNPGPEGFDRVVVRGTPDARDESSDGGTWTAWWLRDGTIVAGMHVNDWDAIDDVRRLVGTRVDPDRLADERVPLGDL
jgi:3-phenylpropionate/trans-cinnamate dioxygenase ferredoxin reductase subunit